MTTITIINDYCNHIRKDQLITIVTIITILVSIVNIVTGTMKGFRNKSITFFKVNISEYI